MPPNPSFERTRGKTVCLRRASVAAGGSLAALGQLLHKVRMLSVAVAFGILAAVASSVSAAASSDLASLAAAFARQLTVQSPVHDGVPLRVYVLRDLDNDGLFEVLEYVSAFENTPGFMNVELNGAFEWVNIYVLDKGGYHMRTGSFRWFLTERHEHYQFWLRVLESPAALTADGRALVKANAAKFRSVLIDYLRKIQELQ